MQRRDAVVLLCGAFFVGSCDMDVPDKAPGLAIRPAAIGDVSAMVGMIQDYRKTLAEFQPQFWKPAFGASASSAAYFGGLVVREDALCLVAEEDGKAIGFALVTPTPAPPVYDPGGPTVTLDDFCVADSNRWPEVGAALLTQVRKAGRERGWSQLVVVSPERHDQKNALLQTAGLTIASNWWTTPL